MRTRYSTQPSARESLLPPHAFPDFGERFLEVFDRIHKVVGRDAYQSCQLLHQVVHVNGQFPCDILAIK